MPGPICVVDDDALVREQLCAVLIAEGFETVEADSADQAARLIKRRGCTGAVIDILMSQRDGLDLIRELRETNTDLKIVAISGGGRVSAALYLKFARDVGADVCLEKPVRPEALIRAFNNPEVTEFQPFRAQDMARIA